MIQTPDYYSSFSCIADKCSHSCCVGWEIDIDEKTYNKYKNASGEFSKRLLQGITPDGKSFILDENERCPFLNKSGLCDIITNLGKDSLCQICDDHPRFRNFFPSVTEIGLGLCCEEACRLILSKKDKTYIEIVNSVTDWERTFFASRNRLFELAQDRTKPISVRLDDILSLFGAEHTDIGIDFYKILERLDDSWECVLDNISDGFYDNGIALEQLLCYFIFRHTADSLETGALFAVHATTFIARLAFNKTFEEFCDICRMYSSEIEYSDENLEKIKAEF